MSSHTDQENGGGTKSRLKALWWSLVVVVPLVLCIWPLALQFESRSRESTPRVSNRSAAPTRTSLPTPTFSQWERRAESISYDSLARHTHQYEGRLVSFRGRIANIAHESSSYVELWVYLKRTQLTGHWIENKMVLIYRDGFMGVLVDDFIKFVGEVDGRGSDNAPRLRVKAFEIEK